MTSLSRRERIGVIALILLAWALRWVALMDVPPGWRDDDLIELYTFSGVVADEGPRLYFTGASGHEPLYHTLRAPLVAAAGINAASARVMSAGAGTLAVLLTWAVGRRVLGRTAGFMAAFLVTVSFWSLMYSRVAIRHMGALPWMLVAIYWGWRTLRDRQTTWRAVLGIAVGTGGALLTYYAGRVMPFFLVALYPLATTRKNRWRPYFTGLGLGVAISLPMFWAITQLLGADARVGEVAVPLRALADGNLQPVLQTVWTTLGMFHAKGDPEWLYNYSLRPVFGPIGAVLFYLSLIINALQWRRPGSRMLLLWLAAGISPAFISYPPSSYGHSIMALPATYLLLASYLPELAQRLQMPRRWMLPVATILAAIIAGRDLSDYFVQWPAHSMVQFLYRADYRALSDYACRREDANDITVGSFLYGVWDSVALETDCTDPQLRVRWVNPERAIVFVGGKTTPLHLQDENLRHPAIEAVLAVARKIDGPTGMQSYLLEPVLPPADAITQTLDGTPTRDLPFAGAMKLEAVARIASSTQDGQVDIATWWHIEDELPLPPKELIPQPPPPNVYSGPRLKVFAHLWSGEELIGVDDGIWVDSYSLVPGDLLLQFHSFNLPDGTKAPEEAYVLELGLYDPQTGVRWTTPSGEDNLMLSLRSASTTGN